MQHKNKTIKNLDTILNSTFKYSKEVAKEFYFKQWVPNPPECSAFNKEVVYITREGWDHVRFTRKRTKTDVIGRLFVLERAKELLEHASIFQNHTVDTSKEKRVDYWIFDAIIEKVRIRVVVRSIGGEPKHFLSVIKKGSVDKEIKESK